MYRPFGDELEDEKRQNLYNPYVAPVAQPAATSPQMAPPVQPEEGFTDLSELEKMMNSPDFITTQDDIRADQMDRRKNLAIGAIAGNLSNRQSTGNFMLGQMNPKVTGAQDYFKEVANEGANRENMKAKMLSQAKNMAEMRNYVNKSKNENRTDPFSTAAYSKLFPELSDYLAKKPLTNLQSQQFGDNPAIKAIMAQKAATDQMKEKAAIENEYDVSKLTATQGFTEKENEKNRALEREKSIRQAAKEKEPNKEQNDSATFAKEMEAADLDMQAILKGGYDPTSAGSSVQRHLPGFMEGMKGEKQKLQDQAERRFLTSVLRKESGAAISADEFASGSVQYFPRQGDTPAVLAQKERNRKSRIESMKKSSGRAYGGGPSSDVLAGNPKAVTGTSGKPKRVYQGGHTYILNEATGKYE
jgi:hypothetical protein